MVSAEQVAKLMRNMLQYDAICCNMLQYALDGKLQHVETLQSSVRALWDQDLKEAERFRSQLT